MAATSDDLIAGRYRVVGRAGSGGMGTVSIAKDTVLGRQVAIKRLHPDRAAGVTGRFRREARLGAAANHPSLVTVYDALAVEDGGVLIVMEYVEGQTLADALRHGALDPDRALAVLDDVASGLDYLHERGVVHRDVKPSNVLLGLSGRSKLADLGVATAEDVTQITQSGAVLGTAPYVAPEVFEGEPCSAASDVYSFGALAFETLSGRKANPGRTPAEIVNSVLRKPPPDLREAWPAVPAAAAVAVERAMARTPGDRPRSACELVTELREALGAGPALPEAKHHPRDRPETRGRQAQATPDTWPLSAQEEPTPVSPPPDHGRIAGPTWSPRPWAGPIGLAAAALGVAVALMFASNDSSPRSDGSGRTQDRTPTRRASPSPAGGQAVPTPVRALQDFYRAAADHRYDAAWALATPRLRARFGSLERLRGTFSTLRSITFTRAQMTGGTDDRATVAFATVAVHTHKTDRCSGNASLVRQGRWLVDELGVTC